MKNKIFSAKAMLAFLGAVLITTETAADEQPVTLSGLKLDKRGDYITVSFTAAADRKAVRSDYTLTSVPVLANGSNRAELPPVIVQGRRARIEAKRMAMSDGGRRNAEPRIAYAIGNGSAVNYTATVPYAAWMEGSELRLEQRSEGCCSSTPLAGAMLALNNVFVKPEPAPVPVPPVVEKLAVPKPVKTTGDRMTEKHPFVALLTGRAFDDGYFEDFAKSSREGSLTLFFRQGSNIIEHDFHGNGHSIDELLQVIRTIENSKDSRITAITIAGFASPEGTQQVNYRLAMRRGNALKEMILKNTNIPESDVVVHNGGVDWWGLRRMVEGSDMAKKQQVLDIIDNIPVEIDYRRNIDRNKQLMDLDGGRPWRYMYQNFFPDLRNATYIKVYYENR